VRVAEHKRNIILPPSLAPYRPKGAKFEDGALTVTFERTEPSDGELDTPDDRRDAAAALP
jgi:hypothetical protein